MKHTVTRLAKLYRAFFRVNLLSSLEYRTDFVVTFVSTTLYSVGYILFLGVIVRQVPVVAGWKFDHLLLLFAINQLIYYLSWGFFRDSLRMLPYAIKNGDIDILLKLPVPIKFLATINGQSFDFIFPALGAIGIFFYAIRDLSINPGQWVLFLGLFLLGLTIYYFLVHIVTVMTFWVIESEDLIGILEEMGDYGRYPLAFFPKPLAFFFIFVIPILLIIYVPASVLIENLFDWKLAGITILMCIALKFFSDWMWKKALEHYSGVSS